MAGGVSRCFIGSLFYGHEDTMAPSFSRGATGVDDTSDPIGALLTEEERAYLLSTRLYTADVTDTVTRRRCDPVYL